MLQSTVNFACGGKCNILPLTTYIITLSHFGEKKFINVFDDLFRAWILIQLKRYCVQCCVPSTYFGCCMISSKFARSVKFRKVVNARTKQL